MARRRTSVVDEEAKFGFAEPQTKAEGELVVLGDEQVVVVDGVIDRGEETASEEVSLALVNDGAASGVGVSADELRRMVELDEDRRAIIREYIARNLKSGIDYGTIPIQGRESKPSLFKPGAEKICMLLQLRAEFEPDHDTLAMAGNIEGLFAYRCRLLDRFGRVVGEGRGASDLNEKRGWTVNNAIKICEKRAQIDAVLRVVCLSEIFTQDIEDPEQRAMMENRNKIASNSRSSLALAEGARGATQEQPARRVREEMCNDIQAKQMRALMPRAGVTEGELLTSLNLNSIRELSYNKAERVIARLSEKAQARAR